MLWAVVVDQSLFSYALHEEANEAVIPRVLSAPCCCAARVIHEKREFGLDLPHSLTPVRLF